MARLTLFLVAAFALPTAGAQSAAAATGVYQGSRPISTTALTAASGVPHVAFDSTGAATATWADGAPQVTVHAARHLIGQIDFGAAVVVARAPASGTITDAPVIAEDSAGDTTIAWTQSADGATDAPTPVWIATRLAGNQVFGAPVRISAPDDAAYAPQITMADDGSTTVAWLSLLSDGRAQVRSAETGPGPGASFSDAADRSEPGVIPDSPPSISMAPSGATALAWVRTIEPSGSDPDGAEVAEVARRGAQQAGFGAPVVIRRTTGASDFIVTAQVAAAPDGTTVAFTERDSGTADHDGSSETTVRTAGPGADFGEACVLPATAVGMKVDSTGSLAVASLSGAGMLLTRQSIAAPCSGVGAQTFSIEGDLYSVELGADRVGGVHLTWTDGYDDGLAVHSAARAPVPAAVPGRPDTEPTPYLVDGFRPATQRPAALAVDPFGNQTVTWWSDAGPTSAVIDRAAPRGLAIAGPADALLGSTQSFSLSASDDYSPGISFAWTFAGGSPVYGTGASISHTFSTNMYAVPSPGQSLRATATDDAGNAASALHDVVIVRPPRASPAPEAFGLRMKLGSPRLRAMRHGEDGVVSAAALERGRGTTLNVDAGTTDAGLTTFTLTQYVRAHIVKGRCTTKKPRPVKGKRKPKLGKRCVAAKTHDGEVDLFLAKGVSALGLTGRWNGKKLVPGSYAITGVLTSIGVDSGPTTVRFRIVT